MIANPWENKQILSKKMFIVAFERKILLEYLDIPSLYTFNEHGNRFFKILAGMESTELFRCRSIQIIIMYKWNRLRKLILYLQFFPHIGMLATHLYWHVYIRKARATNIHLNIFLAKES